MEIGLGEKVREILIKSKTLILCHVLGDSWSSFKTPIPLGIMRDSLIKFDSNDDKIVMLHELAHLDPNYFNLDQTLILVNILGDWWTIFKTSNLLGILANFLY